jgi:NhaP-type Na+/H+ or K+/H+ antiporter
MGFCTIFHISSFIAVFFTGAVFAWDGWFVTETEEAHVQEVIDMLLNLSFFIYFGISPLLALREA